MEKEELYVGDSATRDFRVAVGGTRAALCVALGRHCLRGLKFNIRRGRPG